MDNLTTQEGVGGPQVATNEIGGVHYARSKTGWGAPGVYNDVDATNPMPVADASGNTLLAAIQALLTTLNGTIGTSNQPYISGSDGQLILARRRDADSSPAADGDMTVLNIDDEGRLKVASKPASYAAITGNITANGQTVFVDCVRFSNLMIHCSGTFAGANVTFEGSLNSTNGTDGNWFAVQAVRSNANTIELTTGVLAAAPAYAWELSVNALKYFRVRATAFTSGTQVWTFVPGTYATEPIPAAQISGTQPVSFTQPALVAGTAAIGDVGLQVRANATGAASIHHIVSAATTNVAQIKATAGRVIGYCFSNTTASWQYVKFHNVASATAGAGVVMTVGIPPNGKAECNIPHGIGFATAISRSIVTGPADTDATATTLNAVVGDVFFA
ncbi:hypothetical protein [Silanimonas sp.]|uniref:hypothetical protein n=1 Tax=Silanimonas sp. TaxID=1929290 RepID=UPI0022BC47F3|nr:hypothetical protein [Silanimonas sp.]MCZ8113821.1 hypothetical protein [Silanimonas sp.]